MVDAAMLARLGVEPVAVSVGQPQIFLLLQPGGS